MTYKVNLQLVGGFLLSRIDCLDKQIRDLGAIVLCSLHLPVLEVGVL